MTLWVKLSIDILGDPKLMRADRRGLKWLVFLPWFIAWAKKENDGGRLSIGGEPADAEDFVGAFPDATTKRIQESLDHLVEIGVLERDSDGALRFARWERRQYGKPSNTPERTRERKQNERDRRRGVTPSVTLDVTPGVTPQSKSEREERESKSESESEVTPLAAARVALPAGAIDLLNRFYEPALTESQRERYREVKAQLYDVLDPLHAGVKIRGGVRVKARSAEHLDETCRKVIDDPPRDRDMAIVFVLKKLTDPAPGPSAAERRVKDEQEERALEEVYRSEAEAAGKRWAHANVIEYGQVLRQLDSEFPPNNAFAKIARDAALIQRCARAAEFPSFDEWVRARAAPDSATAEPMSIAR